MNSLDNENTPIQEFYENKSIFLTGGTGFFGKIIIEKLLRTTNVKHIYILIRVKKGKDIYTRLDEIFDDPIFSIIKSDQPLYRNKITLISGDCLLPELGISSENRKILTDKIDIIIHSAATVRFDEKLKTAISINVRGTKEIINLARECKNLLACVHVSTAFANCNHREINENFYPIKLSGLNACKLIDCLNEKTMDAITPELIKNYPNTYTFTKALAENLIWEYGRNLPITVFRPGIVLTTYSEPIEGWINNMYGPCGIVLGVGAGILRVFHGNKNNRAHIVPVDMAVNCLLATAWDICKEFKENSEKLNKNQEITESYENEPPIYNYIPDNDNPISWNDYLQSGIEYGFKIPLSKSIWYPIINVTTSKFWFNVMIMFYHILPAYLMDAGLVVVGKKPKLTQIYKKVHKFCAVMSYFSNNSWTFTNTNTRQLWDKLSAEDKKLFFFNMKEIEWRRLFEVSLLGLRTYMAKDDPITIPYSVKRTQRLKILHYTIIYTIYGILGFVLWFCIKSFFV